MENQNKEKQQNTEKEIEKEGYTKDEIPFADGKDTKLDQAIDDTSKTNNKKEDK